MKATLMWTANDFLANEMLSRWSAHGKLVFLYYIKNNKAFTLMNDEKHFFYCHKRFLLIGLEVTSPPSRLVSKKAFSWPKIHFLYPLQGTHL